MTKIEMEMVKDKDTKNTYRFVGGSEGANGNVYLMKNQLSGETPEKIKVTIEF